MANRITEKHLHGLIARLNDETGNPDTYRMPNCGPINVGNYHIDWAYGGCQLVQTSNTSGGVRNVLSSGFVTKRELYDLICAYLKGIEAGKVAE